MALLALRRGFLFWCLLFFWFIVSPPATTEPTGAQILIERMKRVSRDEVHFTLRVTNRSDRPIFFSGISDELGQRLDPVHLEQWRSKEGWTAISCIDTPPPHVLRLNPGQTIVQELRLVLPMSVVCKNRITQLEGRFRFRLEFFESEKQARGYMKKLFSPRRQEARAQMAVSEPFEMPPVQNSEH